MASVTMKNISTDQTAPPTLDEVRRLYGPPKVYGVPSDAVAAMDEGLMSGGVYSLLQHTWEMGQMPLPQFLGYGSLQTISQNGLIRACVSTVADDMTRNWIDIQREGDAEDGADDSLITKLSAVMDDLKLKDIFHEAVELCGYEGGCLIFIDTGTENLSLPLNITRNSLELQKGGHLRFIPIDPVNVFPGNYNSINPLRTDYYRPHTWWVQGTQVHASRLLRIVANEVPILLKPSFNFLGLPQSQILWDYVCHFNECRSAVARLLTKFSLTVFKTAMFDGTTFGSKQSGHLDQRIKYMAKNMTNDGVLAIDKDAEDVVKVETPLGGCTDIVRQALEFLAAVNRTPAVKLLGISPSGFNATGESDLRNYYDHISSMQRKVLLGPLKVALDCLQLHVAGQIDPSVTLTFNPLSEEDKSQSASLRKQTADTIAVYLDRDVISAEEARKKLADDPDSGFSDLDPSDVPPPKDDGGEGGLPGQSGPDGGAAPTQTPPKAGSEPQQDSSEEEMNESQKKAMASKGLNPNNPAQVQAFEKGIQYAQDSRLAMDEEVWRTTSGGKHYMVDTETGEVTKGNIGPVKNVNEGKKGGSKGAKNPNYGRKDYPRNGTYPHGLRSETNFRSVDHSKQDKIVPAGEASVHSPSDNREGHTPFELRDRIDISNLKPTRESVSNALYSLSEEIRKDGFERHPGSNYVTPLDSLYNKVRDHLFENNYSLKGRQEFCKEMKRAKKEGII